MPKDSRRRARGSGSVFKRADGRWVAQVLLSYDDRGRAQYKVGYAGTQREAVEKLNSFQSSVITGTVLPTGRLTVADFLDTWLRDCIVSKREPKTVAYYETNIRLHIKPSLGKLDLKRLTPIQVQALINEKSATGLAPLTVRAIKATLRSALSQAERWGLVARNAAMPVTTPKVLRSDPEFLDPQAARTLIASLDGFHLGNLIKVTLATGMRIGEATGLTWADVDFRTGTISLNQQLQRVDGKLILKPLKSRSSRRTLPMTEMAQEALYLERQVQQTYLLAAGQAELNPMNLVFLNPEGRALDPKYVNNHMRRHMTECGLDPVSFHKLRHTAASLMVASGVPLSLVKDQLGHSSILLTSGTYAHMVPASQRQAAESLERILNQGSF